MGQHTPQKISNNSLASDAVPFLDFDQGYDGIATTAEKNAAELGAKTRGTKSRSIYQAKRDRCKRGKSCGATCIFQRKDCVLELPVSVQNSIRSIRQFLVDKMNRGEISERDASRAFLRATGLGNVRDARGRLSRENVGKEAKDVVWKKTADGRTVRAKGAEQGKAAPAQGRMVEAVKKMRLSQRHEEIKKEIANVMREAPSAKEGKERVKEAIALGLMQAQGKREGSVKAITSEQQAGLKAPQQQALFQRGQEIFTKTEAQGYKTAQEFNQATKGALASVHSDRTPSAAETRLLLATMHPDTNKALLEKGDITKGIGINGKQLPYWGTNEPTRDSPIIPKPANVTPEQEMRMAREGNRFQIANSFLATRGIDPYTGRREQLHNMDLEHFIPENVAKAWANSGGNRILTASSINQMKANLSFEKSLYADSGNRMYGQTGSSPKRILLKDLESGTVNAARVLATAGALPRGVLDFKAEKELNSAVILNLTRKVDGKGVVQAVSVGMTGGGKNNNQGFYLFGGKEGSGWDPKASAALGARIASTLAKWEGQGREGTMKMSDLTRVLMQVQSQVRGINNQDWQGTPIRQIGFKQNPQAKRYVEGQIKSIMEQNLPRIEGILNL